MISLCFDKIGENKKFDLTELEVTGYKDEEGEGSTLDEVYLDLLNFDGTTAVKYEYIDSPDDDFPAGWYDADYEPISKGTCFIEAGDGVWVSAEDNFKFLSSGQVIEKSRGIKLRHGGTAAGNLLARVVNLKEIKITGYEEAGSTLDEVYVDILKYDGTTDVKYEYIDSPDDDFPAGWYNEDYEEIADDAQTLNPGQGIWVSAEDGFNIEFPDL